MYYKNNDISLYYEKHGTKDKNIIILPGWGNNAKTFNYLINFFKDQYTIYIMDYPGFGNSSFPNKDLTIYDYSNLIYEFIITNDIKNPILIAHSFGGRIAILLNSIYNLNINKTILMDTAGIKMFSWKNTINRYQYKLLKKLGYLLPKKIRQKYHKYLLNKYSSLDYQSLPNNMKKTFSNIINENLKKYLPNIRKELLMIWGQLDNITPIKEAYVIKKNLPLATIIPIKDAHHFPYLEYPLLVAQIINSYIK